MIDPINFDRLLGGHLVGISDRLLRAHLDLYRGYVDALNAIEREYPLVDWTRPRDGQMPTPPAVRELLTKPIASLKLVPEGKLADLIAKVIQELRAAGITWTPGFYLGDDGFWTTDKATSVNIPWYLASPALWWLVNDRKAKYTEQDVGRALRHEAGHALGYAFKLYEIPAWEKVFGDFEQPYGDVYLADPTSTDFVKYMHRAGDKHYAQKHPDEDWAETFATWLDPTSDWREAYPEGTGARKKLEYVEALMREGALKGDPLNTDPGERRPYTQLYQSIESYLGDAGPSAVWSAHSELLRREPYAYNAVVLHEKYFQNLGRDLPGPGPLITRHAVAAFGSVESWLLDLRAAAGSTSGWALTVWDARRARLMNVLVEDHRTGIPADSDVLLAIDCWEHAYASDYGTRKDIYLAAFFLNVSWQRVHERLTAAAPNIPPLAGIQLVQNFPDSSPDAFVEAFGKDR